MSEPDVDRCKGAILGLALGDAFGAPYEGGMLERALWRLIGRTGGRMRWTDDTQMSIDLAESLIANGGVNQDDLARRFAASYRWSRGYGPGTTKVLRTISRGRDWVSASMRVYPGGSYGNGGAMRAPVAGLYFRNEDLPQIAGAAHRQSEVTHAHPLALDGAALISMATAMFCNGTEPLPLMERLVDYSSCSEMREKLVKARRWLESGNTMPVAEVAAELGNGTAAAESVVTAVYIALAHHQSKFEALLAYAIKLGGDV
ncbi:MAG TPA: hypothetical protein ENO21_00745, partial [Firmicutes bacterium]|nr:hypothetical protein [Bacillota bacterium]